MAKMFVLWGSRNGAMTVGEGGTDARAGWQRVGEVALWKGRRGQINKEREREERREKRREF